MHDYLGDEVFDRLLRDGDFGDSFEKLSVGECNAMLATATKVIMETFAADIGQRLKGQLDGAMGGETQESPAESPVIPDLAEYLQKMAVAALNRALREIDAEQAVEQFAVA